MPNLLFALLFSLGVAAFLFFRQRRLHRAQRSALEDRQLWVGLAAGLFDAEDCPSTSRLEIALSAIARKLGLRAAIVTLHGYERCTVVANAGTDPNLLVGLEPGAKVLRESLYCGSVIARGRSLTIDYASLSEWRRHRAFRGRAWESYIAVHCGLEHGEDVVVAFFDTRPRGRPFTRAERALVEQLAPWVAAMVSGPGSVPAFSTVPDAEAVREF